MTDPHVSHADEHGTSASLLVRAAAQDGAAWVRLAALYSPLVRHWCRGWGLRPDAAEDIVQETLAAVAKGLAGFQSSPQAPGSFRSWLYTIARHEAVDYLRKQGRDAAGSGGVGGSDALRRQQQIAAESASDDDAPALDQEKQLLYRQALRLIRGSFSDTDWTAFFQVVCHERAPADVAQDLGVTVNKVYLAKSRILRRLREEFRDLIDGIH